MSTPQPAGRKRLPVRPSEENLRKHAKRRARQDQIPLAEAQRLLAREYGARHWAELMHIVQTMLRGADQTTDVKYEMEALPKAANANDLAAVERILGSGAFTQHDLDLALARSVLRFDQRGRIAQLLLEHGADPNGQYGSGYGPIVFGCGESLDVEGLRFLIDAGADVTFAPIDTKYGTTCPLITWTGTYVRGRNDAKHRGIDLLLQHGAFVPPELTPPILAIHRGDAAELGRLLDADPGLAHRRFADMPHGNIRLAGATLLHCAVEFGEIECIEQLLRHHAEINAPADIIDGVGGQTPIYHAINTNADGNFYTLEHLVQRVGQHIDMSVKATWRGHAGWAIRDFDPTTMAMTPLEYAQKAARDIDPKHAHYKPRAEDELRLLRSLDRRAAIRAACAAGDIEAVRAMLDASPELLTPELWPPAIFRAGSIELTRLLLDRGLDPNRSASPRKPLHLACDRGHADIVRLLLARGARLDVVDGENTTPYELLCTDLASPPNQDELRQLLRDAGAVDTVFTHMYLGQDDQAVAMLREDPALREARGPVGFTPLQTAARAARPAVVAMLLQTGVPADSPADTANSPLWLACQSNADAAGRMEVARRLLEAGANVNRRCEDGTTALHFAAWRGPAAMVKLLLDAGGRQWLPDARGKTVMDHARESSVNPDKQATVKLLTEIDYGDENFARAVAMIDRGDVEGLKRLLAEHPHVVTMRVMGDSAITRGYFTRPTLLHFVAMNPTRNDAQHMPPRILESTTAILDAGAEVDAMTPHELGGTTLALVASSGPAHADALVVPLLELLVSRAADPTHGLAAAILHRLTDTARHLLRLGARHTLLSAAGLGELDALRGLLQAGMGPEVLVRAGSAAAVNGQAAAIDLLIDAGLDPNARLPRPFDPTLLHEAAWHNERATCERLLARGADRTIRDTQYDGTPAHWARHAGHRELAELLDPPAPPTTS